MAHGHPDARFYPLGMVWEEASIVVERINNEAASNTALLQIAGAAVMGKPGLQQLKKVLKELTSG